MKETIGQDNGVALARQLAMLARTAEILTDPQAARPTETVFAELQGLFDTFNGDLFADELPDCMLTVDMACRAAYGYFRPNAFTRANGHVIDQISLNPTYMLSRPMREVAGTVAHEMAHQWMQRCSGKRMRGGYHCKAWGRKMQAIGLMPSNTGKLGGRQTGYRMTHYPIAGGHFLGVVAGLEAQGFALTWGRFQQNLQTGGARTGSPDESKGKVKHRCPECAQACWGSPSLNLICGHDRQPLHRVGP